MADLRTDYKDDVLDTSVNTQRKYQMITNEDGTVSFTDVTEYSQVGDTFGAVDVNAMNEAVNAKAEASHTHDDTYYTEAEVNNLLTGKAATSHTHAFSQISGLSFSLSGTTLTITKS